MQSAKSKIGCSCGRGISRPLLKIYGAPDAKCRAPSAKCRGMKTDLKARTKAFALRVLKLIDALPSSRKGRIIADQLGRAGTAVGANYRATCRARSRAEFIAKIGVVEEEADESAYWLEIISEGGVLAAAKLSALHKEAMELTAIMASSRITASRHRKV
jgi:four helix bundle protein